MTGREAAQLAHPRNGGQHDDRIKDFIVGASARDIQAFINNIQIDVNSAYLQWARPALEILLAEQAAKTAQKLLEIADTQKQLLENAGNQAENLSKQTDRLVQETVTLTRLTRGLYALTFILGIFAAIQIVIMLLDYFSKNH